MFLFIFSVILLSSGVSVHASRVEPQPNVHVDNHFPTGPTSIDIVGAPGDVITKEIHVTNRFGKEKAYSIEIEDFQGSSDDPDQTVLLQADQSGRYGAKDWIEPEFYEFSNNHADRTFFDVTIRIPENADAGDHYGSVLISPEREADEIEGEGTTPTIKVRSRVGVLFFITVTGETVENGSLQTFEINEPWYEKGPVNFRSVFRNEGTVRLRPHGEIVIKNMTGMAVETIEVEPYNVLRNSVRGMNYVWNPQKFLIGKYTAEFTLYNGYTDIPDGQIASFWIVPWKHILTLVGTLLAFVLILRFMRRNVEVKVKKK